MMGWWFENDDDDDDDDDDVVVDEVGDIVGADLVQVSEDVGEFPGAVFLLEDFPAPRNG